MDAFTWGMSPKSQTDPQLISEAITAAITAHESDPDAHLGAGESLQSHRAAVIIDHEASSIVPDKFSYNQREMTTYFESATGWITLRHAQFGFISFLLSVIGNDTGDSYAYNDSISFSEDGSYSPLDNYVQFNLEFDNFYSIADFYFGMGVLDAVPSGDYRAFYRLQGTTLSVGFSTSGSVVYHTIGTLSSNVKHVFRIETLKITKVMNFWVDGVIVFTADLSGLSDWNYTTFGVYGHKTGGTTNAQFKKLYMNYLAFWNETFGS